MSVIERIGCVALGVALTTILSGCGTPGAPQPPSLDLPDQVTDLSALRSGNRVSLTWTMPKKNTDKLMLRSDVEVQVCRREGAGTCESLGHSLHLAPGAVGSFTEVLSPPLSSGVPRPLNYFVELKNRKGRSTGLSNAAEVLAGQAPSQILGLRAEARREGVVLRWNSNSETAAVRLHRKLLTPAPQKSQQGLLAPPAEPLEESLIVDAGSETAHAIDRNVRLNQAYEYRAERIERVAVDGKTLELAGEVSAPIHVDTKDVFPPAVPTRLAAIATVTGAETAVDLSWQPNAESDLSGYIVYRREGGTDWLRISPDAPNTAPAFRDAHVQPGHTYHYTVSAIGAGGSESPKSEEATETVPAP